MNGASEGSSGGTFLLFPFPLLTATARLLFDPSVDGVLVKPLMLPRLEARQRSRPNQFVERRLGDLQVRRELDNGEDLVLVFRHRENPCQ